MKSMCHCKEVQMRTNAGMGTRHHKIASAMHHNERDPKMGALEV